MKCGGWAKLCCLPCCSSGVRHEWACPWKTLNLWLKWCLQRFVSSWSLGPCVCTEVSSQATARRVFLFCFCCLLWFVIVSFFFPLFAVTKYHNVQEVDAKAIFAAKTFKNYTALTSVEMRPSKPSEHHRHCTSLNVYTIYYHYMI